MQKFMKTISLFFLSTVLD